MNEELIAPCGMNCAICSGYLAMEHDVKSRGVKMPYCKGCKPRDKMCAFLKKRCDLLMEGNVKYCYECDTFPCRNLEAIDRRYRTRYRMSMLENLETIKDKGIKAFLRKERKKWKCPDCGGTICCHNGLCFGCGLEKLKAKKKRYRWED
jgi:hypothetical protein